MNTSNRIFNFVFNLIAAFFILGTEVSSALTVQQVKNGKVLISLEGSPAQTGEQFFGVNAANKKTSLIEITVIKGDKAVGKILKGAAQVNDTLTPKNIAPSAEAPVVMAKSSSSFIRYDMKKIAISLKSSTDLISTLQQDANTPVANQETVDMNGTNIGLNVSMGIPLNKTLTIQGFVGYEMLKVAGTAIRLVCDGKLSRDCNVDITYATFGGLARANYNLGSLSLWAGAGVGFKQPLTKKSTALTLDNISLSNAAIAALGVDYHLNNKYFIPLSFEYHKSFNESDTVPKINHMAITLGFGFMY